MFTKFFSLILLASVPVTAQRPASTSICDYYTTALFNTNTESTQAQLLTALVNRVVAGNFTPTANGKPVTGILAAGNFNGESVDLLPFFTGASKTSNVGGVATAVNFLDGGGAAPLQLGQPANDNSSKQYVLLTHLYQVFGSLLGCTQQGGSIFPDYAGKPSMYEVHKFMKLSKNQIGYFNDQVGQAAISFGVTTEDATAVGASLESLFNVKCSIPTKLTPKSDNAPQGMCGSNDCKKADKGICPGEMPSTNSNSSPSAASTMKSHAESNNFGFALTTFVISSLLV
ncbi:hypothetical protein HDV02_006451 [Globomyces sp. JEL0801]|nr:hypothetical protein HDV02_006451 [Globomyces sp. JEL0801]